MREKLILAAALMFGLVPVAVNCQTETVAANSSTKLSPQTTKAIANPAMTEIRGVSLGMTADAVKEKLGKPKIDDADGFYYSFSNAESLQVRLDADGKVYVASITYTGGNAPSVPDPDDVFGASKVVTPRADGRIHEIVRYPEAGYWISYSRIMLDSGPMITVTMQKIRK